MSERISRRQMLRVTACGLVATSMSQILQGEARVFAAKKEVREAEQGFIGLQFSSAYEKARKDIPVFRRIAQAHKRVAEGAQKTMYGAAIGMASIAFLLIDNQFSE